MEQCMTFGVLGGDRRQICLARFLKKSGYDVSLSCLDTAPGAEQFPLLSPEELACRCGVILLPLPVTRDGRFLNAPFSRSPVSLDDGFASLFSGKKVLGGMTKQLTASSPLWEKAELSDYYLREELILGNAFLTAEGALGLAITEYEGALGGSRCLVTGFGRIGKALCVALRGLGARVDCFARRPEALTAIRSLGCRALAPGDLRGGYDVIFNTVPAPVLTAGILAEQQPDVLILELASPPGGVDAKAAETLGLRVIHAPSLPGRMSPGASGELIGRTVCAMLEEY